MRGLRALVVAIVGGILALAQGGCLVAAAAGGAAATVAYVKGDLSATLDAPPDRVVEATKMAMNDMKFTVTSAKASSEDGEVVARTATDNKVDVEVKALSAATSKVSIRVGTFGDEDVSTRVLDRIRANLKPVAATKVP